MKDFVVLMPKDMRPLVAEQLRETFTLQESYKESDPTAFEAGVAETIKGIACRGVQVDDAYLDRFPNLEIIANFGVGYDNIDAAACARRGVVVTNTPDVLTEEVADTAIGLLIMTGRELGSAERWVRAGKWEGQGPFPLTKGTLAKRTMGIVGLGRIGKAIASRAEALGLTIHYHGRNKQEGVAYPYHPTLASMAEAVDTLMLVAPGGAETHHMVNADILKALGPTGVLINIGRGTLVDETALVSALKSGDILSAGLDVFEEEPKVPGELMQLENVVLLPHVGSASVYTRDAMAQLVVDNLVSWSKDRKAVTSVAETAGL